MSDLARSPGEKYDARGGAGGGGEVGRVRVYVRVEAAEGDVRGRGSNYSFTARMLLLLQLCAI